jgi:hypothetical protein
MRELTRLLLIAAVLTAAYTVALVCIALPWTWVAVAAFVMLALLYKAPSLWSMGTSRWADYRDLTGIEAAIASNRRGNCSSPTRS